MKVSGTDPTTGKQVEATVQNIEGGFFEEMRNFEMSEEGVKKLIDSLKISADAKSLLFTFSKVTIKVGDFVFKVGRKIIDFVCTFFKDFPTVTFGAIFGAITGHLIASIPYLGYFLGPFFMPIVIALGLSVGLYNDLKDKALKRKIDEAIATFKPLQPAE